MPAEIATTKVDADIDLYIFAKLAKLAKLENLTITELVTSILAKGVINPS